MIREEAIKFMKAIKRGLKSTGKDYPYRDEYIPKMKEALEMAINALKEPRTGHWIDHQDGRWIYAKCSECGKVQDAKSNFCPYCGADMRGVEE